MSLAQIGAWGGLRGFAGVEEAASLFGIGESDPVWRLTLVDMAGIAWWAVEVGDAEDEALTHIENIALAYEQGEWLPPIMIIELSETGDDGHSVQPIDGSHRVRAAVSIGLTHLPAWVASEQPPSEVEDRP